MDDIDKLFTAMSEDFLASFAQINSFFDHLESLSDHVQVSVPMELQKPQTLRERMFQPQAVTGPVNIGAPQQQSLRQSLLTPESDLTLSAGNVAYFDDIESQPDSKVTSDQNQSTASATGEITSAIPQSGWRTLWSGMLNDAETHDSTTKVFKTSYKYRSTTINGQKTEIVEQQDAQGNKEMRTTTSEDGKQHVMVVRTRADGSVETEETIDGMRIGDAPSLTPSPSSGGWFGWLWGR